MCCLGNMLTSIGCSAFFMLTVFFVVGYIAQISAAGEQFINTESSNVDPEHIFTLREYLCQNSMRLNACDSFVCFLKHDI